MKQNSTKERKYTRKSSYTKLAKKFLKGKTPLTAAIIIVLGAVYSIFAYIRTGTIVPTMELIDGLPTFRFVDVGQGDCVLVTYQGDSVLVDAGPRSSGTTAAEYVSMYAPHVDYFFITHPHEDHMGGAADILESVTVDCLVMSDLVADEEFYTDAIKAAKKQGTEIIYLTSGAEYDIGNISIDVLDLFEFYSDDYNNSSLFIKIEADGTTLLVTGDSEAEEEEYAFEKYGGELDCDILKVGHHGSRTSSSEEFLEAVTPNDAVISCGRTNSYGHPTSEVLDRLNEDGIIVYRTDLEGNVVLRGEKAA